MNKNEKKVATENHISYQFRHDKFSILKRKSNPVCMKYEKHETHFLAVLKAYFNSAVLFTMSGCFELTLYTKRKSNLAVSSHSLLDFHCFELT